MHAHTCAVGKLGAERTPGGWIRYYRSRSEPSSGRLAGPAARWTNCSCPLGKILTYKNLIYLLNFPVSKKPCSFCDVLTPEQKLQISTPFYQKKKEKCEQRTALAEKGAENVSETLVDPSLVSVVGLLLLIARL